jgi:hypothetical protein
VRTRVDFIGLDWIGQSPIHPSQCMVVSFSFRHRHVDDSTTKYVPWGGAEKDQRAPQWEYRHACTRAFSCLLHSWGHLRPERPGPERLFPQPCWLWWCCGSAAAVTGSRQCEVGCTLFWVCNCGSRWRFYWSFFAAAWWW